MASPIDFHWFCVGTIEVNGWCHCLDTKQYMFKYIKISSSLNIFKMFCRRQSHTANDDIFVNYPFKNSIEWPITHRIALWQNYK